jgi:hypothetical protein
MVREIDSPTPIRRASAACGYLCIVANVCFRLVAEISGELNCSSAALVELPGKTNVNARPTNIS